MWTAEYPVFFGYTRTGLGTSLLFALVRAGVIDPTIRDLNSASSGVTITEDGNGAYDWKYTNMPDSLGNARIVFYLTPIGSGSSFSGSTVLGELAIGSLDEWAAKNVSGGSATVILLTGSGITLTFVDSNNNPVANVAFTIYASGVPIGSAVSGTNGVKTFGLPNGTYNIQGMVTNGIVFPLTPLTVSGVAALTITGTSPVIPSPPSAAQTMGYYYTDIANTVITYWMTNPPPGSGMEFDGDIQYMQSSSSGDYWSTPMYKGATYNIQCGNGPVVTVTIPSNAGANTPLNNLLGLSS